MRPWPARTVALLALTSALVVAPALPAAADEAECADSRYVTGGYETFPIEAKYVPPPLRSHPWDCAIKAASRDFDPSYATSNQFLLLYVDIAFDEVVAILRSWEDQGYAAADEPIQYRPDAATQQQAVRGATELGALDPAPGWASVRFSNLFDGHNIYEFEYTDGVGFQGTSGIPDLPQLLISIILTEPFAETTGIADPSVLSGLRTMAQALPSGVQWGVIGGGSLFLMLIVGWPSTLLNSVIGSRYQALVQWVQARLKRGSPPDGSPERSRLPGWLMWPGFALAAIIGAFADPAFGVNWMSLRVVITLFLSFLLFNLAAWAVVRAVARRLQPDAGPYLRFRWGSLALVALTVLVARLLGLHPGVIFGLVAGIAYASTLRASRSAAVVLAGSGFGLALAAVAWAGYSLIAPVPADGNVVLVFAGEFLSGVTIKGVSTLPLSLLPLGNLDGAKLWGWQKLGWGAAYAVGLGAFMVVLLTIPKSWGEIPGDFLRWALLFGGYALVAVVVWGVNAWRLRTKPPPAEAEQGDQPDAITID